MAQLHELTSQSRSPVAECLGWLSVGLGLAALFAPRKMGEITGLDGRHGLVRLVGARELASGVGLLTQTRKTPWLWSRVIGDAIPGFGGRSSCPVRSKAAGLDDRHLDSERCNFQRQ